MSRLLKLLLVVTVLALLSGGWFTYTLFLETALLKGAHHTLKQRHSRTQQALKKSQRELKQTQKKLSHSQKRLAKVEANKPKGVRKLATKASKIPLLGTIPSIGLIAADLYDCYQQPTLCKEGAEALYDEGKAYLSTPE